MILESNGEQCDSFNHVYTRGLLAGRGKGGGREIMKGDDSVYEN